MTRRILLTGATGFVGRQVLKSLQERGADVRIVVRGGRRLPVGFAIGNSNTIFSPDIFSEDEHWWCATCQSIDAVVHAAWYAEPGRYLLSSKNIDCLSGTLALAKGAVSAGVRRFVGVGSCFEYAFSNEPLTVDARIEPLTPYAAAKVAAYLTLSRWLVSVNVGFAWCRLFYLFGDGEDERRLVPYLRAKLKAGEPAELTSGQQVRDFMDVCDAGQLIARVALGEMQGAINICSGMPLTVRNLALRIADEFGRRDLLRFGVRQGNVTDPPYVVGERTEVL